MEPFDRGGHNKARVRPVVHHGPWEGGGWRLEAELDTSPRHFLEGVARVLERAARALAASERPAYLRRAGREMARNVRVPDREWDGLGADFVEGAAAIRAIVERRRAARADDA